MANLKKFYRSKTFRFYTLRLLVTVVILLLYMMLWRPARILVTEQLVYPQVKLLESPQSTYQSALEGGAIAVHYVHGGSAKELHYRPQFGFFMLVALVPMIFITAHPKPYWLLGGIHLAGSLLAYLCLIIGAMGVPAGFILVDAINGYLVPGLSLAMVPLVINGMIIKKKED
jgi:hypothetical protein